MRLCILWSRHFEVTFENTQWRKAKQMQPVWICIFSGRQFEEAFENAQCANSQTNLTRGTIVIDGCLLWLPKQAVCEEMVEITTSIMIIIVINCDYHPYNHIIGTIIVAYQINSSIQPQSSTPNQMILIWISSPPFHVYSCSNCIHVLSCGTLFAMLVLVMVMVMMRCCVMWPPGDDHWPGGSQVVIVHRPLASLQNWFQAHFL